MQLHDSLNTTGINNFIKKMRPFNTRCIGIETGSRYANVFISQNCIPDLRIVQSTFPQGNNSFLNIR